MRITVKRRLYPLLLGSAFLSLLLSSAGTAQAQTQTANFAVSGAFANESTCSQSGSLLTCIFVDVNNESSTQTTPGISPFLSYLYFTTDLNTGVYQDFGGFGQIPVTAFKALGNTDTLSVDTSTVQGFINFTTVCDPDCQGFSAPGGLVTGTWTGLGTGGSQNGTTTNSFPGATFIVTGTSDFHEAFAIVSVLGVAATGGSAMIGTQHNAYINIQRH